MRVNQSARHAIADAASRFAFSATPRLDAEMLMAHALGIDRQPDHVGDHAPDGRVRVRLVPQAAVGLSS